MPISVDDAAKIVMSLGLLKPEEEDPRKTAIAAAAKLKGKKKKAVEADQVSPPSST